MLLLGCTVKYSQAPTCDAGKAKAPADPPRFPVNGSGVIYILLLLIEVGFPLYCMLILSFFSFVTPVTSTGNTQHCAITVGPVTTPKPLIRPSLRFGLLTKQAVATAPRLAPLSLLATQYESIL